MIDIERDEGKGKEFLLLPSIFACGGFIVYEKNYKRF